MKFFQPQERPHFNFNCLHVRQLTANTNPGKDKTGRKPFERYKDMKLAIKLIEKDQAIHLDQDLPSVRPSTSGTTSTSSYFYFNPSQTLTSKRKWVVHKKPNLIRYKNLVTKALTIDRWTKLR